MDPLYALRTQGMGGTRLTPPPPRTFLPSRTTSMPNFVQIRPEVWIYIDNIHTHRDIALYLVEDSPKLP